MKKSRALSLLMAAALTLTSVNMLPTGAEAAKKPKLSRSKTTVAVGKTVTLKVKNGKKSAKVVWKNSKKAVAKITKSSKKGASASATVKGVKKGKTTITALYKLGKTTIKLACKLTVKEASKPKPTLAPPTASAVPPTTAPSTAPTLVPPTTAPTSVTTDKPEPTTAATATVKPSKKPSAVPKTATPIPTQTPVPAVDATINQTHTAIVVDGTIDDAWSGAEAMTIGNWTADEGKTTSQTTNAKAKFLWDANNFYVLVTADDPEIDTGNEAGYYQDSIEFFFDEHNYKTDWGVHNEFQYRVVFDEKAEKKGSLTDKTYWDGKDIAFASMMTETGYAVEICIPFTDAHKADDYVGVEVQINDASAAERNGTWNLFSNPAGGTNIPYDDLRVFGDCKLAATTPATATPEPTETPDPNATATPDPDATPNPTAAPVPDAAFFGAVFNDGEITADGEIEEAWNKAPFTPLTAGLNGGAVTAKTKVMWDEGNLYALVVVDDTNIDKSADGVWNRDGGELFLNEDLSTEESYADNKDAFQYRLTGFTAAGDAAETNGIASADNDAKTKYDDITASYKIRKDENNNVIGYVMEYLIPFAKEGGHVAGDEIGFDISAFDCTDGTRAREMMLFGGTTLFQSPQNIAKMKLLSPEAKAYYTTDTVAVDGIAEEAWDDVDYAPVAVGLGDGYVTSGAKLMWDNTNLYVLVKVADSNIDKTASADHEFDGGEVFLDEDLSGQKEYDVNTDAFQYRLTGFDNDGSAPARKDFASSSAAAKATYADIAAAYSVDKDSAGKVTGYTMEFAIPFAKKTGYESGTEIGFDLNVFDCSNGARLREMMLLGEAGRDLYQDASKISKIELFGKETPTD